MDENYFKCEVCGLLVLKKWFKRHNGSQYCLRQAGHTKLGILYNNRITAVNGELFQCDDGFQGSWSSCLFHLRGVDRGNTHLIEGGSWCKGLTKFSDKRINTIATKNSINKKGKPGRKHTAAAKDKISAAKITQLSKIPFYSKRYSFNGVTLHSTYELKVAMSLQEANITWERPSHCLLWLDETQIRRYLPDFYLPYYNVYLDPKNDFLIKKDARKIKLAEEYNNVKILVLNKNELNWDSIFKKITDRIS
jgi:hypothetical protein